MSTVAGVSNTANTGTTNARGSGCLKCGQTGHWARDCTATADQIKRFKDVRETKEVHKPLGTASIAASGRHHRPKLTVDLLEESQGIPDVQENFFVSMKAVYRGKGHEISDTRRLLELYNRWSTRILPVTSKTETFDTFIATLENFSTKAVVKDMMNRKRQEVLKRALDASILDKMAEAIEQEQEDDELLALVNQPYNKEENHPVVIDNDDELMDLVFD